MTKAKGLLFEYINEESVQIPTPTQFVTNSNGAFIDTGVPFTNKTTLEIQFEKGRDNGNEGMLGVTAGTNATRVQLYHSAAINGLQYNFGTNVVNGHALPLNAVHTLKIANNKSYIYDVSKKMWITYAPDAPEVSINTAPYTIYLYRFNNAGVAGTFMILKIYYCKIWENGVLVRHFVPHKDTNNVVGLYDQITQAMFYNMHSTGAFTLGTRP